MVSAEHQRLQAQLWKTFVLAWPGKGLPRVKPEATHLMKKVLPRGSIYHPPFGAVFLLLSGRLEDHVMSPLGATSVLRCWHHGEVIPGLQGKGRVTKTTHLLELTGWEQGLPEIEAELEKARQWFLKWLVDQLSLRKEHTCHERIEYFLKQHPDETSPTQVAKYVGVSREQCSRTLKALGARKERL